MSDPTLSGGAVKTEELFPDRDDSGAARSYLEGRPAETLFLADWKDALFLHFRVDPDRLQSEIPFRIDRFGGNAFVSLVAFTMKRFRLKWGGKLGQWLMRPLATQRFLNLRSYVLGDAGSGIFFIREWLDHPLAVRLGRATFGLPYRRAKLSFDHEGLCPGGKASNENGFFEYGAYNDETPALLNSGSRDEFLLERYIAYAGEGRVPTFFRIWHPPWEVSPLRRIDIDDDSLLDSEMESWWPGAELVGGHLTRGVEAVWMGRPHHA
ncbi:MAG: DUF2071 domain-containing protein [Verrucomicrobiota bacterium]